MKRIAFTLGILAFVIVYISILALLAFAVKGALEFIRDNSLAVLTASVAGIVVLITVPPLTRFLGKSH